MEPIMFLILTISIMGIMVFLGLSQFKIENNVSTHFDGGNHDFNSFMTKIKGNSLKVRR
ncbi:MAG: hypothetical protein RLZZ306_145 [Bacteroidota bacterium]|jgi:hypothetical protein